MPKKIAMFILTGASVLCALEPVSMLSATDQDWLRGERAFVLFLAGVLFFAVALLWSRVRWAPGLCVVTFTIFGFYQARWLFGTIQSGNYDGVDVLVFLLLMGACPFVAAVAVLVWGRDFCPATIAQPTGGDEPPPRVSV